ncbi:MAG: glycoside hydrolase family 99-like domain-containing protein, partial [Deltaproteobacteria bacterium]|nr:glycoside hydrolase family 99-like domain-containing protein [Deltaproteobacteria bacterium]
FSDKRYITLEGEPLFLVYRPTFHSRTHFSDVMEELRLLARKQGLPGLHIVLVRKNPADFLLRDYGGDALVEFSPLPHQSTPSLHKDILFKDFKGKIYDLRVVVEEYKKAAAREEPTYYCVAPMWDNTARKRTSGCMIFDHASPALYEDWLRCAISRAKQEHSRERSLVFLNAWNEWGEGAHLEPDRKYGYAFLEATGRAILNTR